MFRSVLISPNSQLNRELTATLLETGAAEIIRTLEDYPAVEELLRIIHVRRAELVFLSVDDLAKAEAIAAALDDNAPGLPIVTLSATLDAHMLTDLMHLGIREHLTSPLEAQKVADTLASVERRVKKHPLPKVRLADIYTFLPAKPGVGTSTIALGASCALADDLGVHTLLLDCDLAAGAIQFLLKLGTSASIVDALSHSQNLDEDLWSQMTGKWDKLDVLHAGGHETPPSIDSAGFQRILAIARPQYDVICADLASSLDPFSIEWMRESQRIFLVTTPEMVPVHFASERLQALRQLGLADRVSLLLNRKPGGRNQLDSAEVARSVGLEVAFCFSNDYAGVQGAILDARPVSQHSDLGQSILNLAHSLAPRAAEKKPAPYHRKFLEFFHVPREVDQDVVWRG